MKWASRFLILTVLAGCASEQSASSNADPADANEPDKDSDRGAKDTGSSDPSKATAAPKASATWCSKQKAAFCADFDGDDVSEGWAVEGDTLMIASTASDRSSPHALAVTRSVTNGNIGLRTRLTKHSPKAIHVAFDLKVAASGVAGESFYDQVVTVQIPDEAQERVVEGVSLELRTDTSGVPLTQLQAFSLLEEETTPPKNVEMADVATLPFDHWVAVGIDVDLSSSTKLEVKLTYDGVDAGSVDVARAPASVANALLAIGSLMPVYPSTVGPAPFKASFDNVLFDVQ